MTRYLLCLFVAAIVPTAAAQTITGEVRAGKEFHRAIGGGLTFQLHPTETGWTIRILPNTPCGKGADWAYVVNPPYRGFNQLYLDTGYSIPALESMKRTPRPFNYVLNCQDYKSESKRLAVVLWPYNYSAKEVDAAQDKLGSTPQGKARLDIVDFKVSRAAKDIEGTNYGKIDWMKFRLVIVPRP